MNSSIISISESSDSFEVIKQTEIVSITSDTSNHEMFPIQDKYIFETVSIKETSTTNNIEQSSPVVPVFPPKIVLSPIPEKKLIPENLEWNEIERLITTEILDEFQEQKMFMYQLALLGQVIDNNRDFIPYNHHCLKPLALQQNYYEHYYQIILNRLRYISQYRDITDTPELYEDMNLYSIVKSILIRMLNDYQFKSITKENLITLINEETEEYTNISEKEHLSNVAQTVNIMKIKIMNSMYHHFQEINDITSATRLNIGKGYEIFQNIINCIHDFHTLQCKLEDIITKCIKMRQKKFMFQYSLEEIDQEHYIPDEVQELQLSWLTDIQKLLSTVYVNIPDDQNEINRIVNQYYGAVRVAMVERIRINEAYKNTIAAMEEDTE